MTKTALQRGSALALLFAVSFGPSGHAADSSQAELAAQIQALQAQVEALKARLDAHERAQSEARAQAAEVQTQAQAVEARAAAAEGQLKAVEAKIAASEAKIAALPPPPAYTVAFDGAPRISAGGSSVKIRGRLILDGTWQTIDRPGGGVLDSRVSQVRGRQAFLGIEGNIGPNWFYKVEGGAVNGGGWNWDDAYLEYRHDARNAVVIGAQKTVGLENLTSQRFVSFIDRGPMDTLIDATYHLGLAYWRTGRNYSLNAAVTGHTLNSPDVVPAAGSSGQHERLTANARATFAPVNDADTTVHLGGWVRYRKRGDDGMFAYTGGYNSPYKVQTLLATGPVGDHDRTFGLEGALVHKSLSLQGEWATTAVSRGATAAIGETADLNAGYAFVSFFPTGERRAYNVRGEFGRTRVLKPLSKNGFGAVELLARYDFADFTGAKTPAGAPLLNGGTYDALTLGATWYPTNYVKFLANWTRGEFDNVGTANDADVDLFQVRGQIDW